jgi:BASS family bile acid:Na+ symporter
MDNEFIVRLLTIGSLAGLLLAVGMKLSIEQVLEALRKRRLTLIVIANFAIVPAIVLAVTEFYGFRTEISIGMILLAAAPFAPWCRSLHAWRKRTWPWPPG